MTSRVHGQRRGRARHADLLGIERNEREEARHPPQPEQHQDAGKEAGRVEQSGRTFRTSPAAAASTAGAVSGTSHARPAATT